VCLTASAVEAEGLVRSLSRFALEVRLVEGRKSGRLRAGRVLRIGPATAAERLRRDLGVARVIEDELACRGFEFSVERAVFLTVLHRLFASGSDRSCEKRKGFPRRRGSPRRGPGRREAPDDLTTESTEVAENGGEPDSPEGQPF
jgi:hypothetical protein